MIRFACFVLLLASTLQAEITIQTSSAKSLSGLTGPRVVAGVVLFASDSKPTIANVAIVKITSPAKFVDVTAKRFSVVDGVVKVDSANVTELETRVYMIAGSGVYNVEVGAFDPVTGIDRKSVEIKIDGVEPVPPPQPPTPQPPQPQPVKSFRVIFVKESGQTLNAEQTPISSAKSIREYLVSKTTPESGLVGYREYDPQQNITNEQPAMKALWAAAKSSVTSVPCIVVEVNSKISIIPYPKNTSEALKILKEYGQ